MYAFRTRANEWKIPKRFIFVQKGETKYCQNRRVIEQVQKEIKFGVVNPLRSTQKGKEVNLSE